MDMYRCHKCFRKLRGANIAFFLTQCGHIFCKACLDSNTCHECKTPNVQTIQLSENMPASVSSLFTPVPQLLSQAQATAQFQTKEADIFLRRLNTLRQKYNAAKMTYWQMEQKMKIKSKECRKLLEIRKYYQTHHSPVAGVSRPPWKGYPPVNRILESLPTPIRSPDRANFAGYQTDDSSACSVVTVRSRQRLDPNNSTPRTFRMLQQPPLRH